MGDVVFAKGKEGWNQRAAQFLDLPTNTYEHLQATQETEEPSKRTSTAVLHCLPLVATPPNPTSQATKESQKAQHLPFSRPPDLGPGGGPAGGGGGPPTEVE